MAIKYSTAIINDRLTQLNTDIGASAKLELYSGTRPANVAAAITSQVLLATVTGNASGFGTVSAGTLTAGAMTSGTGSAGAAGGTTATWFRLYKSDGTTACVDGDVGLSGADLNLTNTSIATGQSVAVSSFVITGAPV